MLRPAVRLALSLVLLQAGRGESTEVKARPAPTVFVLDAQSLVRTRERLIQGDASLRVAAARLMRDAERVLELKPPSVMDKPLTPASGDKHDYFSYGPYWWPDPEKPGGLPYIRRDGEVNPESDSGTDDIAFGRLCDAVETLGLAYWFSGEERFAAKAAVLTRVWFLDPATRMNPNFQHAQAIPGITPGRGIGLIESRRLMKLNEGLALIASAASWKAEDREAFKTWLREFYRWLTTSSNARDESKAENNHGTWYDAQTAHLALVLGLKDDAAKILTAGLTKRLAAHIEPDGSQPLELARTRSLAYSLFNLEALFTCARLGDASRLDWWAFKTKDGRSLERALAYLAPYVDASKPWPKQDVLAADRLRLLPLLGEYLAHVESAPLRALYLKHSPDAPADARFRLTSPLP